MVKPDPLGIVALVWDDSIDAAWQIEALTFMAHVVMNTPDPDDYIQSWVDMAGEADSYHVKWTLGVWQQFQTMPVFSCEMVLRELAALRAQNDLECNDSGVK